ncbi:amidohydrolase family protein [Pseudomonas putida]|uniref:amidohydrolase family protein n=1 Tax=Pseudomonas putida TaxID=303 RepID=UPI00125F5C5E|nr:amidohydrolase family protein [Pseudomonas putida]KAB5625423.1 amidohydrolase family protein [Pseudomonas putida]
MKRSSLASACLLAIMALSNASFAANVTVLDGAQLFDGSGKPVIENSRVVIQDGIIKAAGAAADVTIPAGAIVTQYKGKTIIPGLISDHSHLGQYDATISGSPFNEATIVRQLLQYEGFGVTTVVSMGVNGPEFYPIREKLRSHSIKGADIFGADKGIGVPLGAPPAKVGADQLDRPATPDEARAAVRAAAARGTDLIKLWLDDFQGAHLVKMEPAIYTAAIDEAHQQGLRVVAHIYYLQDAKDLIKAGADVLGHGVRDSLIDDEFVSLMRTHGTWYIPTLGVDEASFRFAEQPELLKDPSVRKALNPKLLAQFEDPKWRETQLANPGLKLWHQGLENNLRNTKRLVDENLAVGFGTDSGAMPLRVPGYAEHRELELLVHAGMTPAQALALATGKAADMMKLTDRGRIEAGKRADLVVVDGDPTKNIEALDNIVEVRSFGEKASLTFTPY